MSPATDLQEHWQDKSDNRRAHTQYLQTSAFALVATTTQHLTSELGHHPTITMSQGTRDINDTTYPLVVEAPQFVQHVEEIHILLAAEPVHVSDLEIAPVMTPVPTVTTRIAASEIAHKGSVR